MIMMLRGGRQIVLIRVGFVNQRQAIIWLFLGQWMTNCFLLCKS